MAYALEADLDAKWGAETVTLAAWNPETMMRDEARLAAGLANAAATIDGYLARRYPLPIVPTDSGRALLVSLCCDLAMGQLANTPGARNDIVVDAEKRALAFLKDVAKGDAAIDVVLPPSAAPAVSPNEAIVETTPAAARRSGWRML